MKIRSLKTLATWFTMAMMASSTGVFAQDDNFGVDAVQREFNHDIHCCGHKRVEHLRDVVTSDFHSIFGAENNVFSVQGTATDPNPATNAAIAGSIASNRVVIAANTASYIHALRELGVGPVYRARIATQNAALVDALFQYSLDLNLANVGQPAGDQLADAQAIATAASNLGQVLADISDNSRILTIVQNIATFQTQLIQAHRGVLADSNQWNADPADPATEAAAATRINARIHHLAKVLGTLLVYEVAHAECGRR